MKVKEESEKVGLKLNIQETKIMASGPITSWLINGETVETVSDFIFWGSKITADGDCSHKIKRRLLLGRKVMTNLDSIFLLFSWHPYNSNIGPLNVVFKVSETVLTSLHSFVLILLCFNYFHHSIFQLTYPFFCLSYSATESL